MALNRDRIQKAADQYIRSGKVEKAVAEYEKWVAANPKDWNTIRQIGDLYARLGRNKEAIAKYAQIADYYRQDGFNVRAIATHKMILRLDPQNEKAMRSLAELQVMQGLLMEAKAQYQALVELYTKAGHKKQSTEVFKKLAEIDPSDLKVRYKFAEFLEREGRVGEAVAEYVGIADEFINKGLVAEAIQIMEKGLRIDHMSRLLRTKLAHAASLQGHHDRAIQLLEEVRDQYPKDVELLSRLGEAYMGAGRGSEAERVFGRLAELEPANSEHASRLGELAIGQGNFDHALEILAPAIDHLVGNREGDKASGQLQKILSRDPHHIKTLLKLVEVQTISKNDAGIVAAYDKLCEGYSKRGDYEKAVRVAEQLIELEPENSQHRDRVRFLKSKVGGGPSAPPAPPPELVRESAPDLTPDMSDMDVAEMTEMPGMPPAMPAMPPMPAMPAMNDELAEPTLEMDHDVAEPDLETSEPVIDVDAAVSTGLDPEPAYAEAAAPAQMADEIEAVASLSAEDDEHIKEKMTEAEVFVRYGLVDKAVDQLKEVLERFRFHTAGREKLIEIYRDQGMSTEAAQELMVLSSILTRLGKTEEAEKARIEARSINPALEDAPAETFAGEDEVDLTLEEAPDHYEELTADATHEPPEVAVGPAGSEEVPVSLDEEDISLAMEDDTASVAEPRTASEPEMDVVVDEAQDGLEIEVEVPTPGEPDADFDEAAAPDTDVSIPGDEFGVPIADDVAVDAPEVEIDLGGITGEETDDDVQVEFEVGASERAVHPDEPESLAAPEIPEGLDELEEDRTHPPGAPSPVPTAPSSAPARDELTEVDEYMALGLYEDARHTLRELLRERPDDPLVLGKIEEVGFSAAQLMREIESPVDEPPAAEPAVASLGSLGSLGTPSTEGASQPFASQAEAVEEDPLASLEGVGPVSTSDGFGDDYVDLASELSDEVFGTQSAVQETSPTGNPSDALTDPGLDEMFREFKKGVEKQLGSEDYDTRYNLGIAYKEMGLLDEAIAEFQLASKDEGRLLECCSMLGLCFLEKGMPEIAIKWFEKGLSAPGRSEEEQHGLRYDLATAYEAAGEPDRALQLYKDIYRVNARFRDVKDRVQGLQAAKN